MKLAIVKVHVYAPFPKNIEVKAKGSSYSIIASRGARMALKQCNMRRLDKKQPITITIIPITSL